MSDHSEGQSSSVQPRYNPGAEVGNKRSGLPEFRKQSVAKYLKVQLLTSQKSAVKDGSAALPASLFDNTGWPWQSWFVQLLKIVVA